METAITNEDIIKVLNELIQLDFDASRSYEEAIDHVDEGDFEVRSDLRSFMSDHINHIADLSVVVRELGGTPIEPEPDVKGVLLEVMTKLRSMTGTLGALKAMRMNEKLTNRSYEKAVEREIPIAARDVVLSNLEDERRHLATIEEHIERLGADLEDIETEDRQAADVDTGDLHPNVRM